MSNSIRHSPDPAAPASSGRRPRWRRVLAIVLGIILAPLGLLWFLQGADVVRIEPIACVGNCDPIMGGSLVWAIVGAVTLLVGVALLVLGLRRRHRS